MGGHGGLNILPQKSWNVYNRDNRTKVARDEAKARKKEAAEEERYLRAEREYRHKLLLRRAGRDVPDAEEAPQTADGLLASIFDNTEPESNAEHPENVEKRVEEQRRRGNPDTQTSDAKFDERFAFAFNMGKVQPWYAKEPVAEAPGDKPSPTGQPSMLQQHLNQQQQRRQVQHSAPAGTPSTSGSSCESEPSSDRQRSRKRRKHSSRKRRRRSASSSGDSSSGSESDSGSSSDGRRSWKRRGRDGRSSKGRKSKHRRKERGKDGPAAKAGVKTLEELRQERLQRELAEKARSSNVLRASMATEDLPGVYNTSFGYAAALKKSRAGQ